jgi:primosomal protein N''
MSDNLAVLVEAKKEYLGQLANTMCEPMIDVFQELYETAVRESKNRKPLVMFQKYLKEVPNWSNAMSKNHADNITERCSYFSDLLAAVFVAVTKILSSVRLKQDNQKISLKVPTNEIFIQTVYNNCAKDLYKDPYIYHEEQSEWVRDEKLKRRFTACIEETVQQLTPVQQILSTYMSSAGTEKNIDLDGESPIEDSEDPDIDEEEGEGEGENKEEGEGGEGEEGNAADDLAQPQPTPPTATVMQPALNEFKTVEGVQSTVPEPSPMSTPAPPIAQPAPAAQQPPGVFFNDAADTRPPVKNGMY